MAKKTKATPVKFGPKERRVYYGPKKPRWMRSASDVGVRTVISIGGEKSRGAIKFSGTANVEWNGDVRHLADALRTVIGIHTGRAAAAGTRPDTGIEHKQTATIRTRKMYERELSLGASPGDYDVVSHVKRGSNKGQPSQWRRTRMLRTGDTAASWRVGIISGSSFSAKTMVYPSDEIPVRVAAAAMLKDGYDLHSVGGNVSKLINEVVTEFAKACIGNGVAVPDKPPTTSARMAKSVVGSTWYRVS